MDGDQDEACDTASVAQVGSRNALQPMQWVCEFEYLVLNAMCVVVPSSHVATLLVPLVFEEGLAMWGARRPYIFQTITPRIICMPKSLIFLG